MDDNQKMYKYYQSMYNTYSGNPEMQNKVVSAMYDYFSPDAVSQRQSQQQFMNMITGNPGAGMSATNTPVASQYQISNLNPKYADAVNSVLGSYTGNQQGSPYGNIDDNAMYDVPDELLNAQTKNKTEQAIGDISKAAAPGLTTWHGLPVRLITQASGLNQQVPTWEQAQRYKIGGSSLGDLYSQLGKDAPFITDLIQRGGDVANNFWGKKIYPSYM